MKVSEGRRSATVVESIFSPIFSELIMAINGASDYESKWGAATATASQEVQEDKASVKKER